MWESYKILRKIFAKELFVSELFKKLLIIYNYELKNNEPYDHRLWDFFSLCEMLTVSVGFPRSPVTSASVISK